MQRSYANRLRRWFVRVVVFLLLGAVVNVAVAWGCGLQDLSRIAGEIQYSANIPDEFWNRIPEHLLNRGGNVSGVSDTYCVTKTIGGEVHQIGFMQMIYGRQSYGPDTIVHIERVGWPWLALECHGVVDVHEIIQPSTPPIPIQWHDGFEQEIPWATNVVSVVFAKSNYTRPLPYRPFVIGFALNTVFYAVILWLLFAAPFALRRWRRVRRGLCVKCAYPVGESDVCTECGAGVKRPHELRT